MKKGLQQIIKHDFTKEFKDFEYEVKFDMRNQYLGVSECLGLVEKCLMGSKKFILYKIRGGDKLVTRSVFLQKDGIEYSFFKYRGARMLKVKKHKIIKAKPFSAFINRERLLIDNGDFSKKLRSFRHRFRRHSYSLINLEARLKKLISEAEYTGEMVKTRVKVFVLDVFDGRIYAIAVTFCKSKNKIQRQLEIEYSGYITGYSGFKKNSKKQVMSGLLGLSKYVYKRLLGVLKPSVERKFEFVKEAYGK